MVLSRRSLFFIARKAMACFTLIFVLFLCLSQKSIVPKAYAVTVPMPAFALQFSGNFNDSSTNGKNGTKVGTVASIVTDGTRGQVLSLNQTQASFISVPQALPTNFTKSAWVYLNTSTPGLYNIISNSASNVSNFFWVANDTPGGAPSTTTLRSGHWTNVSTRVNYVWDANAFPVNTWVHVAMTYNNTGRVYKLYMNGSLISTTTAANSPLASSSTFVGNFAAAADNWSGYIDDAEMWSSVLADDQIAAVYGGDTGTVVAPSAIANLVAFGRDGQAQLSWTAPTSTGASITDYQVEYKLSSDSSYTTVSHAPFTTASYTVTGLSNLQLYDFRVEAINSIGTGAVSNVATTMPLAIQFTEDFDSLTNGSIGGQNSWTLGGDGTWTVGTDGASGKMVTEVSSGKFYADYISNGTLQSTNQRAKFDFKIASTAFIPQIFLRKTSLTGDAGGYLLYYNAGSWVISKHTAGSGDTFTQLTSIATPITISTGTWYTMEVTAINNTSGHPVLTMVVYPRGNTPAPINYVGSYTDASDTFLTGAFSLNGAGTDSGVSYDNFSLASNDTQQLNITFPRRDVAAASSSASLAVTDEGGTFYIPYIQTSTTLAASATTGGSYLPASGGVKFVLNQGQGSEQVQYDMSSPFTASFTSLPKATYTLNTYVVDSGQNVVAGAGRSDSMSGIGIGDIITGIGDSITAGYPYTFTAQPNWTLAAGGTISSDNRNYPQDDPATHVYRIGYSRELNNSLTAYYGYPVFFMNEGVSAYKASDYVTLMAQTQWQTRQAALAPNRWLIHLGVNDANGSVTAATYKTNMQSIITTLLGTYSAVSTNITVARPFYISNSAGARTLEQGYFAKLDELVASNNLSPVVPDFYTFYSFYTASLYADVIHPNTAGYTQMARILEIAVIKPKNVAVNQSAGDMTVTWDDLPETSIAGYKVKYGTSSGTYGTTVDVGDVTTKTVTGLTPGLTYYFVVSAYDNDAHTVTNTLNSDEHSITIGDTTAPSGGSVSYTNGYLTTNSVALTVSDGTDAGSGINTASRIVQRKAAPLTNSSCGSYDSFAPISVLGSYPNFVDNTVISGNCYQYKYLVSDLSSNQANYTSVSVAKIDSEGPAAPGTPTTTTPTTSTSQNWSWSAAVDAATSVASYMWRIVGTASSSGTSVITSLSTSLTEGFYTLYVKGVDALGNIGSESSGGNLTVDTSTPIISSVVAIPDDTAVTITWDTNEDASSQVEYGLSSSYGEITAETDTSPRVPSHNVTVSSLVACTTFHYRVLSADIVAHQATGSDGSFTTTGCTGSDDINAQTSEFVDESAGGSVDLLSSLKGITLDIPAGFDTDSAVFQIKQLDPSEVEGSLPLPGDFQIIGSYVYDLRALTDVSTELTSFDHPITITIAYGASDVIGIDESTLVIYHYHSGSWTPLSDCVVSTIDRTVTCTTTEFSDFALFGEPEPTPSPSPTPSSGGNDGGSGSSTSSTSSTSTPGCGVQPPGSAPNLFEIDPTAKGVKLYFSPVSGPHDRYFVSYGITSDAQTYGFELSNDSNGVIAVDVNALERGRVYFFKVRAGNQCQPGDWSNILAIRAGQTSPAYRWQSLLTAGKTLIQSGITKAVAKPATPQASSALEPAPSSQPAPSPVENSQPANQGFSLGGLWQKITSFFGKH